MKTLGDIIKEYREKHSMSMDDFVKISGLSKSYISVLEKNKRPGTNKPITPTLETINNVAKAMNVDINDLLEELGEQLIQINVSEPTTPYEVKSPRERMIDILSEEGAFGSNGVKIDDFTDEELDQIADRLIDYARFMINDKKLDK